MATATPTAAGPQNETALQIHGEGGYAEEYSVARVYREVAALTIGADGSKVMREVVAREVGL